MVKTIQTQSDPANGLNTAGQIVARRVGACPPERLMMQEEIKLAVECLFAASGLEFVFDRLGIGNHLDRELDVMEDVELVAVHEAMVNLHACGVTKMEK